MAQASIREFDSIDPRQEVLDTWRSQASDNIQSYQELGAVDALVVKDTWMAMAAELVSFEAIKQL